MEKTYLRDFLGRYYSKKIIFRSGIEMAEYILIDTLVIRDCEILGPQPGNILVLHDVLHKNMYTTIEITETLNNENNYEARFSIEDFSFKFDLGRTKLAKLLR